MQQLKIVQSSARHQLSLINDLLDLAKIESGKVELHPEPLICQSIIQELAASLRTMAEAKNLDLEVRVPPEEIHIQSDRRAVSQILLSLANNAIKFTDKGRVRLEVVRREEEDGTLTEFIVADTGSGILPEDQAKLFQAFRQLETPASGVRRAPVLACT